MKLRKILGIFMALLMVAAMIPTALAEGGSTRAAVSYVDENGETQTCTDYTPVTAADETWSGWVVVDDDVTIDHRVYASGEVHLILTDGKTLNVQYGIEVSEMDSLTIYGQTEGTGALNAGDEDIIAVDRNYAGIGGNNHLNAGPITINGGTITARGADGAAGIGGGFYAGGGKITINDGKITAYGGDSGDGIGDGESSDDTSEITINGGEITAYGGASAAGIGVNGFSGEGFIVINDGQVKAYGGPGGGANGDGAGAGIGGDPTCAEVSDITINGGVVWAYGGEPTMDIGAVGIGGGSNGGFIHTININGGSVCAAGTGEFPAIGSFGGVNFTADDPETGTININGGQVEASADGCSFAIGGFCEWFEDAPCYINLSWTNEDDYILADAYQGTVTLVKDFMVKDPDAVFEAGAVEDNSVLAGRMLLPYIPVEIDDGYYLIGPDWTVGSIDETNVFAENPNNAGEYLLNTTLDVDDEIKVVRVENNAITGWWPDGEGTQYTVDEAHSGDVTIYFKTSYVNDWAEFGGYFYIAAQTPAEGYHILVTDYTKGAATTSIVADETYSGEVTFTVTCDKACVVAIVNGEDDCTRLTCTTVDEEHQFTVTVSDADVTIAIAIKGDCNLDGAIRSNDATGAKQASTGSKVLTGMRLLAVDNNGDGVIRPNEATKVAQVATGSVSYTW